MTGVQTCALPILTDIAAAIGLVELERYNDDTLPKRKKIAQRYLELLSNSRFEKPIFKTNQKESSYHLFPLRIKDCNETQRDEIIRKVTLADVSVNVHFIPVPMMSYYKKLGFSMEKYPVAYSNYSREISLPVFYDLSIEQCETIVSVLNSAVQATP